MRTRRLGRRSGALGSGLLAGLLAAGALSGCGEPNTYVPPPPPEVTVARPEKRAVTETMSFTGNLQAVRTAELVARVPGFLEKVMFQDGQDVRENDLLFVIEQAPYRATVVGAEAGLQKAEAELAQAKITTARLQQAARTGAVSRQQLDEAEAREQVAQGQVLAMQAVLDQARIDLGYTEIRAPFSGRIGRRLIDPGNFVGAGGTPTTLATLDQLKPIYAFFNIDERSVLRIKQLQRDRGAPNYRERPVPVSIGLQTEQNFPHTGQIDFVASGIDPNTGTLQVRAIFANTDGSLLPGAFVRIRIPVGERDGTLLVPQLALGTNQAGRYALIVNDEGVVEQRTVTTGPREGQLQVVESGLAADDWVVINGIQRARPGARVTPVREEQAAAAPPAAPTD
ncbi:MAG: efflux RND transporter periplasmic adaptor subunit [Rhodospirillales bacterium]|nr:efflux RND transporter periplasmic adaptor subunit [Rhodospirillales bacterium]